MDEPHRLAQLLELGEDRGLHELDHGQVLQRRLQILADGEKIHFGGAQIVHQLQDFVSLLAQAKLRWQKLWPMRLKRAKFWR